MKIIDTLIRPALLGSLAENLADVRTMFERGPDSELNYVVEFEREITKMQSLPDSSSSHTTV